VLVTKTRLPVTVLPVSPPLDPLPLEPLLPEPPELPEPPLPPLDTGLPETEPLAGACCDEDDPGSGSLFT